MSTDGSDTAGEPWAFILGRPPVDEYLGFLTQASAGADLNVKAAVDRWRAARLEVSDQLTIAEAGAADNAFPSDLPEPLREAADKYLSDPSVSESYAVVPPENCRRPPGQVGRLSAAGELAVRAAASGNDRRMVTYGHWSVRLLSCHAAGTTKHRAGASRRPRTVSFSSRRPLIFVSSELSCSTPLKSLGRCLVVLTPQ